MIEFNENHSTEKEYNQDLLGLSGDADGIENKSYLKQGKQIGTQRKEDWSG